MREHVIRWWGEPADFRLKRVALRGQRPLLVERRRGETWHKLVRVASEREAELAVEHVRAMVARGCDV